MPGKRVAVIGEHHEVVSHRAEAAAKVVEADLVAHAVDLGFVVARVA